MNLKLYILCFQFVFISDVGGQGCSNGLVVPGGFVIDYLRFEKPFKQKRKAGAMHARTAVGAVQSPDHANITLVPETRTQTSVHNFVYNLGK